MVIEIPLATKNQMLSILDSYVIDSRSPLARMNQVGVFGGTNSTGSESG
jgi:hypothetical protein